MWVRQLMRVIEEPMILFAQNKPLLALRESKRTIRHYNRVGGCQWGGQQTVPAAAVHACMRLRTFFVLLVCTTPSLAPRTAKASPLTPRAPR